MKRTEYRDNFEEVEAHVLGLALLFPKRYASMVVELGNVDDFSLVEHRLIFQSLCNLVQEGHSITVSTLWADMNAFRKVNESLYGVINNLSYMAPATVYQNHNVDALKELLAVLRPRGVKRRVSRTLEMIGSQARDEYEPAQDVVAQLEIEVEYIYNMMRGLGLERKGFFSAAELEDAFSKRILDFQLGITTAIPTGLPEFDNEILAQGGMSRKGMYIIASRPGVGKTSLALSIMGHLARQNIPSALSSLEMDKLDLYQRLMSVHASVPYWMFRPGFHGPQVKAVARKIKTFSKLPIYLADSIFTTGEMRRHYKQVVLGPAGVQLLATDYLQLAESNKGRNRYEEVTDISRVCKMLGQELNVPHLALSQLNRNPAREDRAPSLHDLKESGQIEQDAEGVLALWERPEHREDNKRRDYKYVEAIWLKQRNGPTTRKDGSNVMLVYLKEFMQYMTLSQFEAAQRSVKDGQGPLLKDPTEGWEE